MDHFGIGAAIEGAARVYCHTARRTGRTTALVKSLNTGDRVVFCDAREAERVSRMCREQGTHIEYVVIDPGNVAFNKLTNRARPIGRLIFDHSWVEQFYIHAISRAGREIEFLQQEFSGLGTDVKPSPWMTLEIDKWKGV